MERYDVIVGGAGTAGLVAGYVSARLGRKTAIIDCGSPSPPGDVLLNEAAATLQRLGLQISALDHVPCCGITLVTASGANIRPWRGVILDRERFIQGLFDSAVGAGCEIIPGKVLTLHGSKNSGHVSLKVARGSKMQDIDAAFAIDASGRPAALARHLGATRRLFTNLAAAWVSLSANAVDAPPGTLAIETTATHWWYLSVGNRSTLAAALGRKPPRTKISWLKSARSTVMLGKIQWLPQPTMSPANISLLEPAVGNNWLACGDAAGTFDPLSGYGLAFAIGSGYAAARTADRVLRGDRLALLAYEELITSRMHLAWHGLDDAYRGLVVPPDALAGAN